MVIIILSNTANPSYYTMLENCVNSIGNHRIIVVESNKKLKGKDIPLQSKCEFFFPKEEFNYNKFINIAIGYANEDKIIISNNDIVYQPDCVQIIDTALNTYDSVCPTDTNNIKHTENDKKITNHTGPLSFVGYEIGNHVIGCCIGLTKKTYNKIGGFDEQFKFWYQDNDYADLLKTHGLMHARLKDAVITHLGFQSHKLLENNLFDMTHGLEKAYKEKWFL